MTGTAIADLHWVVVGRSPDADTADGEATAKTLRKQDGHTSVIPQNPAFTPTLS
jgi:SOS-response transcriptional repressor LexA